MPQLERPGLPTSGRRDGKTEVSSSDDRSAWTFLTHHARVLMEIVRNPPTVAREGLVDIAGSQGVMTMPNVM